MYDVGMLGLFRMEIGPQHSGTNAFNQTADMEIEIGTEIVLQQYLVCCGRQMRLISVILPEGKPEIGD